LVGDLWVQEFGMKLMAQMARRRQQQEAQSTVTRSVSESYIKGTLRAGKARQYLFWTTASLEAVSLSCHYAYRPKVLIVRTLSGWVMKVEGVSETVQVERLR
jgi:hypothetical protein